MILSVGKLHIKSEVEKDNCISFEVGNHFESVSTIHTNNSFLKEVFILFNIQFYTIKFLILLIVVWSVLFQVFCKKLEKCMYNYMEMDDFVKENE